MSRDLERRIRNLRTAPDRIVPDAAWVRDTRETLLMQVRNTLPAARPSVREQFGGVMQLFSEFQIGSFVRKPVMAVAFLIVCMAGGSIFSVSAAEHPLPGDLFYGLKLVTEQARLAFTSTTDEKLKLKTEFTERRVDELQRSVADEAYREQVPQVAEMLKRDLGTLKEQLSDVMEQSSSAKVVEAAKLIDQKTNAVINALQETKSQLSPEAKEKVTEAQSAASDVGIQAIEVLAAQHKESSEAVPAETVAEAIEGHAKVVANVTGPLDVLVVASSTSSLPPLPPSVASSTEESTASSTLPQLVSQVKDLTAQAFAMQKVRDQLEIAASVLAQTPGESVDTAVSSGTVSGVSDASPTGTLPAVSSTVSGATTSTDAVSVPTTSTSTENNSPPK